MSLDPARINSNLCYDPGTKWAGTPPKPCNKFQPGLTNPNKYKPALGQLLGLFEEGVDHLAHVGDSLQSMGVGLVSLRSIVDN